MATLISPLSSGVRGAESGSAEFYELGTSTPQMAYSDRACTTPLGNTIALDSNGGPAAAKSVYTRKAATVRVRSAAAALVRDFDVVIGDTSVDLEAPSFDDGEPRSALDRWRGSAGAKNFLVRRSGAAADETLVQALTAVAAGNNPFFNLKKYGAAGDGVADDSLAFKAAYNAAVAAGGGVVFVDAGTFRVPSPPTIASPKVSILGCGAAASTLNFGGSTFLISTGSTDPAGMAVGEVTLLSTSSTPLQLISTPLVMFRNVVATGLLGPWDLRSRAMLLNCWLAMDGSSSGQNLVTFTSSADYSMVIGGKYQHDGNTDLDVFDVARPNIIIEGAEIDFSGAAATSYGVHISAAAATDCAVRNCTFATGDSAHRGIFLDADVAFEEQNNRFSGTGKLWSQGASNYVSMIRRLSRLARLNSANSTGTFTADYDAHMNVCVITSGSALTISDTGQRTHGAELLLLIRNSSGSNNTLTLPASWKVDNTTLNNSRQRLYHLMYNAVADQWVQTGAIYDVTT